MQSTPVKLLKRKKAIFAAFLTSFCNYCASLMVCLDPSRTPVSGSINRYPIGTAADKVLADYGRKYKLRRTGNVLPEPVTQEDKKRYIFWFLTVPEDNAVIEFNYFQEVIRVNKFSDLAKPR